MIRSIHDLAFPSSLAPDSRDGSCVPMGLTKRELFAAMAMQGLVSSISQYSKTKDGSPITERHVAQQAVVFADALIATLSDEKCDV